MKKIVFCISMALIVMVCVWSLVLMYGNDQEYEFSFDENLIADVSEQLTDTYVVERADISNVQEWNACVVMEEHAEQIYQTGIEENDEISISVSVGETLKAGMELYRMNGESFYVKENGICLAVNLTKNELEIRILDTRNLYIEAYLPVFYINKGISQLSFNGGFGEQTICLQLKGIDANAVGNTVRVTFSVDQDDFFCFPGTEGIVQACVDTRENVLIAPLESIICMEERDYRVYCLLNGEKTLKSVELGIMNDIYVEITGGVTEGDILIYPEEDINLRTYLLQEEGE